MSDKKEWREIEEHEEEERGEHDHKPKGYLKVSGVFLCAFQTQEHPPFSSFFSLSLSDIESNVKLLDVFFFN